MDIIQWVGGHGFDVLESIGIIASLLLVGFTTYRDERARRLGNLLAITDAHRAIWSELYRQPKLARVLDPKADLTRQPVTDEERLFVTFLIFHLNASFRAMQEGMLITPEALRRDIREFFSLPVPRAVWKSVCDKSDKAFVEFVGSALN